MFEREGDLISPMGIGNRSGGNGGALVCELDISAERVRQLHLPGSAALRFEEPWVPNKNDRGLGA